MNDRSAIAQLRTLVALDRSSPTPPIIVGNEIVVAFPFTFASGFQVLGSIPAGSVCNRVAVRVDMALNAGASLKFGTTSNPTLFTTRLDVVGQFEDDELYTIPLADLLVTTVSPSGSVAGSGILFYKILTP